MNSLNLAVDLCFLLFSRSIKSEITVKSIKMNTAQCWLTHSDMIDKETELFFFL